MSNVKPTLKAYEPFIGTGAPKSAARANVSTDINTDAVGGSVENTGGNAVADLSKYVTKEEYDAVVGERDAVRAEANTKAANPLTYYDDVAKTISNGFGAAEGSIFSGYQSAVESAEARNAAQKEVANINHQKLLKYLPDMQKEKGLYGTGLDESSRIRATNNHMSTLAGIDQNTNYAMSQLYQAYAGQSASRNAQKTSALASAYQNALQMAYSAKRDAKSDEQWQQTFDANEADKAKSDFETTLKDMINAGNVVGARGYVTKYGSQYGDVDTYNSWIENAEIKSVFAGYMDAENYSGAKTYLDDLVKNGTGSVVLKPYYDQLTASETTLTNVKNDITSLVNSGSLDAALKLLNENKDALGKDYNLILSGIGNQIAGRIEQNCQNGVYTDSASLLADIKELEALGIVDRSVISNLKQYAADMETGENSSKVVFGISGLSTISNGNRDNSDYSNDTFHVYINGNDDTKLDINGVVSDKEIIEAASTVPKNNIFMYNNALYVKDEDGTICIINPNEWSENYNKVLQMFYGNNISAPQQSEKDNTYNTYPRGWMPGS